MITVVLSPADPDAMSRTLAALVPAAVEGLVGEVRALGATEPALRALCEDCGAVPVEDFAAALADPRGRRWMLVRGGSTPAPGWVAALEARLRQGGAARVRDAAGGRLGGLFAAAAAVLCAEAPVANDFESAFRRAARGAPWLP